MARAGPALTHSGGPGYGARRAFPRFSMRRRRDPAARPVPAGGAAREARGRLPVAGFDGRIVMNIMRIGISGNRGSFSEEAAESYARKCGIETFEPVYLISVENVLEALKNRSIRKGVFPIENSNGGIVYEAVLAMSRHVFEIEEFFDLDIRMNLLARPGANPSEIRVIISHQQALRQCRMYLKRKWGDTELREYCDTAQAAEDLSRGTLPPESAVIAPRTCADLYGLDLLEEGIQDLKFNYTTFIVAR